MRSAGATVAALGLIFGLGACSSDSDVKKFCQDGAALSEQDFPEDPEGLSKMADKVGEISAPDEIKDDWSVLQSTIRQMADGVSGIDEDDPEQAAKVYQDLAENVDMERFNEAGKAVGEYVDEHCES